jgi:hypothetical protein
MHQVRVIDNQDVGREFCSTMMHRPLPCIGVEADHDAIGTHGTRQHAGETFLTSRHPNFVEPDLGQFGAKGAARRWQKLKLASLKRMLIGQRIAKAPD